MRRIAVRPLLATAFLLAVPLSTHAAYKVSFTAAEGFPSGLKKVAIVTVDCHEMLNCREIERRLSLDLRALVPGFWVATDKDVHEALFNLGAASYDEPLRTELCKSLDADAVIELDVPYGEKGVYGQNTTKSKVFVRIMSKEGEILLTGEGSGRGSTVSTPEGVAAKTALKLLKQALGK